MSNLDSLRSGVVDINSCYFRAALMAWVRAALRGERVPSTLLTFLAPRPGHADVTGERWQPGERGRPNVCLEGPRYDNALARFVVDPRTPGVVIEDLGGIDCRRPMRRSEADMCFIGFGPTRSCVVEIESRNDGGFGLRVCTGTTFVGRFGEDPGESPYLTADRGVRFNLYELVAAAVTLAWIGRVSPLAVVPFVSTGEAALDAATLHVSRWHLPAVLAELVRNDPHPATRFYADAAYRAIVQQLAPCLPLPLRSSSGMTTMSREMIRLAFRYFRQLLREELIAGVIAAAADGRPVMEGYGMIRCPGRMVPGCLDPAMRQRILRGELVTLKVRRIVPRGSLRRLYLARELVALGDEDARRLVVYRLGAAGIGPFMALYEQLDGPEVFVGYRGAGTVLRTLFPAATAEDRNGDSELPSMLGEFEPSRAPTIP